MRERWVHPPLVPREAPPAWRGVWPFRLGALLALALLVAGLLLAYSAFDDAAQQDPGVGALRAVRTASFA